MSDRFSIFIDRAETIISSLYDSYGYVGVTLLSLLIIGFAIEMRYLYLNSKIIKHKGWQRKRRGEVAEPTISVVVPLFGEDSRFATEHLPLILNQKGAKYEVVVVYVGDNKEFFEDMESLKHTYPHALFTHIELNSRFPMSMKGALNIGIKSSQYEYILFTTPEVYPASDMWIASMAKALKGSDVALGYSSVERKGGLGNSIARSYRLTRSVEWLTAAVRAKGYRGIRSNIAFRRELYFMAGGFNHLRLNVGEDDLFLQILIRGRNTEVVLSPDAVVIERVWGGMNWLTSQYRLYNTTFKLYPKSVKRYVRCERWARAMLFGAVIASAVVMPWQFTLAALLLLVIKWGVQINIISKISKRVAERGIAASYPLYDIFSIIYIALMAIVMVRKDKRAWR